MDCDITIIDLITGIVAIAGLGLSITALVLRRLDKKPKLKTNLKLGFMGTPGYGLSNLKLTMQVSNPGEKNVKLSSITLDIKNSDLNLYITKLEGEVNLPHLIEVGESFLFWVDASQIQSSLLEKGYEGKVNLTALANDGFGNSYKSENSIELDLEDDLNE